MRASARKYSGEASVKFWKRVNALPRQQGGETAYVLGCALQDLEARALNYLEAAELRYRPKRVSYGSGKGSTGGRK